MLLDLLNDVLGRLNLVKSLSLDDVVVFDDDSFYCCPPFIKYDILQGEELLGGVMDEFISFLLQCEAKVSAHK